MIKRVIGFDKDDWKHIRFLAVNMFKQFCKGDLLESKDAFYWILVHLTYDSKKRD